MKIAAITTDYGHTIDLLYTDTRSILMVIDTTRDAISAFDLLRS